METPGTVSISSSSSMSSFESLVAAAASLEPIKFDSFEVPAPIKLKEKSIIIKCPSVPSPRRKYNFDVIQAQLEDLQKQDMVYTEIVPGKNPYFA